MTKQQTQAAVKDARPVLSTDDVIHHLVKAHTIFETVTKAESLPLVWESELGFAKRIVTNDASGKLRWVEPATLTAVMENIAHVGLTLNPIKQHGTIIARWNEKANVWEAHWLAMYRGLGYLATQAGVHDIDVDVVYKADTFTLIRTSAGAEYRHEINIAVPRDGDNVFQGVYVAARMPKSGERKVEWVPAEDIYKMRDSSESYRDKEGKLLAHAPWVRWFTEQAKKSGFKRATKRWEEAIYDDTRWQRLQRAIALDHQAEGGGRVLEGQATPIEVPCLTMEQIAEVEKAAGEVYKDPTAQQRYLVKVCNAFGREALADVPAQHHKEILERIAAAKAEKDKRAAARKPAATAG